MAVAQPGAIRDHRFKHSLLSGTHAPQTYEGSEPSLDQKADPHQLDQNHRLDPQNDHFVGTVEPIDCLIVSIDLIATNMSLSTKLANRFREVTLNGRWVALTNLKELLSDVGLDQAQQKVGDLNSIALLTFHINYYIAGLNEVFDGGDLTIRDKFSFDMPPLTTETDWQQLKDEFFKNAEHFASAVEKMTDAQIEGPFIKPEYGDYYRSIEGMIEHCYYHMGQISLLKKLTKSD